MMTNRLYSEFNKSYNSKQDDQWTETLNMVGCYRSKSGFDHILGKHGLVGNQQSGGCSSSFAPDVWTS